jgi:hypothetical protein
MVARSWNCKTLALPAWIAILLAAGPARAQQRDLLRDDDARIVQELERGPVTRMIGGDQRADKLGVRARFESALQARIKSLDRLSNVSEAQKKKLLLAGRVDIDRHLARLEELSVKLTGGETRDRLELQRIKKEIDGLQSLAGPDLFERGSLFAKVFQRTLSSDQLARFDEADRKRARERHDATLTWILETWQLRLSLSGDDRQRVDRFLHEHTRPPRKAGEYDYYGVLLQLSRVPEPTLKMQFHAAQWDVVKTHLLAAKSLEEKLTSGGYLPNDEVADRPQAKHPSALPEKKRG